MKCWAWSTICAASRQLRVEFRRLRHSFMSSLSIVRFLGRLWPACVLLMLAQTCMSAPVVDVELRPVAQVGHVQVTLGDVAALRGDSEEKLSWLRSMSLGAAPRSGTVIVTRGQIERWIKTHAGSNQPNLRWYGAGQVEIGSAQQKVSGSHIADTAKKALQEWLTGRAERSEISELADTRDAMVAPGKLRVIARAPTDDMPHRRMLVWVDIWVDDAFVRVVPVSFAVQAYQTAYVARQDVRVGRIVQDHEFDSRQIDIAESAAPVAVLKDAATWRMKHSVSRGGVLLKNQVEEAPAVARGESATLRSQVGVLTLESKVEVLQDGYPGQMVKVRLAAASGAVLARVTGAGLLEMTEK